MGPPDLAGLVERARAAQPAVAAIPLDERLERAAAGGAALAEIEPELVDSAVAEVGQPRRFARREVESARRLIEALPHFAEAIRPRPVPSVRGHTHLEWAPYGVVLGWHAANSPVWVPTVVALSALVAGNAAVCRPSSRARRTTTRVLGALAQAWPRDAIVVCDLPAADAEPLVWAPGVDAVVAHGSTRTCKRHLAALGRAYAEGVALRPYIPEGSGNDPLLVLSGADLDSAAEAIAIGGFANSGQLCMAAKRIIVERALWPDLAPRLIAAVGALVVGDADDEATDVAPLAPGRARATARATLAEALARGGRLLVGGGVRDGACLPTIVELPLDATDVALWREESFAPIRALVLAGNQDHALALANDTRFALGAAVFGGDAHAVAGIRAARIVVDESPLYQDAQLVVGGVGDSGLGGARPKLEQLAFARRVHHSSTRTCCQCTNASSPGRPSSVPTPDPLQPPYGA